MAESDQEREKRVLEELKGKNVAHYSVLLTAWIQTRMERDKTLVALSTGGIGLLVTILATKGVQSDLEILLFVFAFAGFTVTIGCCLEIYRRNSLHVEGQIRGSVEKSDLRLEQFDRVSMWSFLVAVVFSISIGVVSALNKSFILGG